MVILKYFFYNLTPMFESEFEYELHRPEEEMLELIYLFKSFNNLISQMISDLSSERPTIKEVLKKLFEIISLSNYNCMDPTILSVKNILEIVENDNGKDELMQQLEPKLKLLESVSINEEMGKWGMKKYRMFYFN